MKHTLNDKNISIQLKDVKKRYKLGQIGGATLQADLQSWWAKIRGKEDPNSKIGQEQRLVGQTFMALNGIDLTIYQGEAIGIIGGNGAGKSTLLKLLSRVTAPTDGEIDIYGRVTSMLEVGTGFNGEMTGRENVYMNGAILGMTKTEIDAKMEDIIEFSEVREFIDTPVKRYSSGMFVKLAFSVAAHLDSEIMIMDEVLAVGDMAFQKKCLNRMRAAAESEGRTVLYVSHNMNTIRQLCNRCIVLEKGKIIYNGETEKAIQIYLNSTNSEQSVFVNLMDRARPDNSTGKTFIYNFEFLRKDDCIYKRGESIVFKIEWCAYEQVEEIRYRMIIRHSDDVPVGLTQSGILGNCREKEKNTTVFEFDTSILAEGKYYFSIALFQNDDVGNSIILDHVTRACSFDIISPIKEENKMNWQNRWWGSVVFPDLKVLQEK